MSAWTIGWLGWLAWFVVEEGLALRTGSSAPTLSGHVWRWFAIGRNAGPSAWVRVRRFALLALLAWLAAHLLSGGVF